MKRIRKPPVWMVLYSILLFLGTAGWTTFTLQSSSRGSVVFIPGVERSLALLQQVCKQKETEELRLIASTTKEAALRFQLSEELLFAMMSVESRCLMAAKSHKGAIGLMQLMPGTAKELGYEDATLVRANVFGGAKYLSLLMRRYDGDMSKAVAAYNAGPGALKKHGGKVPPYRETKRYVKGVLAKYQALKGFPGTLEKEV